MRLLITALPLIGCAVMTLRCRRMDRRGSCAPTRADELQALRAEVAELRATSGPASSDVGR